MLLAHRATTCLEEATYIRYGFRGILCFCFFFLMKMANDFGAVKQKDHPQFSICLG